ncbi:MAG: hypothetical protein ACKVTZ_22200 [Bacteroidia bacterium]
MSLNLSYTDRVFVASQKLNYLQQDFADFQAFNPARFTGQFLIDFEAAILAARDFVDDETVVDGGMSLTQTVQEKLKEAQRSYKIIKYFVEDAFAMDLGVQNKFGLDNYKDIRTNAQQMVLFLTNLHAQCVKYEAQLVAKGLNATKITEIGQLKEALYLAVNEQNSFTGERLSTTQTRKQLYETMDSFTQETCRAGKLIYEDIDDAKFQNYTIYQISSSNATTQTHNISANSTEVVINNGIDDTKGIRFFNKGDNALDIYIVASLQDSPTQQRTVAAQETVIIAASSISNGAYNALVVRNLANTVGKYEVEVLEQLPM